MATQLLTGSDFTTGWSASNINATTGQSDSAGGTTAVKLTPDATAGAYHAEFQTPVSVTGSKTYTLRFKCKYTTGSVKGALLLALGAGADSAGDAFDLSTGNIIAGWNTPGGSFLFVSSRIAASTNSYYLCEVVYTTAASTSSVNVQIVPLNWNGSVWQAVFTGNNSDFILVDDPEMWDTYLKDAAGAASGAGSASATGASIRSAAGTASGVGSAAATGSTVGGSTVSAAGTAAGSGTATATGARTAAAAGSAAGAGSAVGSTGVLGISTAVGVASGSSVVTASGRSLGLLPAVTMSDIAALDTANSAEVGVYVDDERSFKDAMDFVAASAGAFYAFDQSSNFRMGRLTPPDTTADPDITINDSMIQGDDLEKVTNKDGDQPVWSVTIKYARYWTTQTQLAGSVSLTNRDDLGRDYRSVTVTDPNVKLKYKMAQTLTIETGLNSLAAATTEAQRILDMFKVPRQMYSVPLKSSVYADAGLQFMKQSKLVINRFGMNDGKMFRITGMSFELQDEQTVLTIWG